MHQGLSENAPPPRCKSCKLRGKVAYLAQWVLHWGSLSALVYPCSIQDGQTVTPIALADDDPDNHVLVCLDEATAAVSVTAAPGLFHDPGDDPNPETSIGVDGG